MSYDLLEQEDTFTFELLDIEGYEEVIKITESKTSLMAIIALHDLSLGQGLGGTRIMPYKTFDDALFDVLRLSKGMTYKSAIAEVGFGGGKSVIIADPKSPNKKELLLAFGRAIHKLKGKYICAEDMGCSLNDVKIIRKETPYVVGLPHKKSSGDPGRFTAWGTFRGIEAVLQKVYGSKDVKNRKIALQGLGNVGMHLIDYLFWRGAEIIVADIDQEKLDFVKNKYHVKIISPDKIYEEKCDVFCPCAMGAILNDETIEKLNTKAIAGAANNQLLDDSHAQMLKDVNILYAPDFVINGGGLLNVAMELEKEGYNPRRAQEKTDNIYHSLLSIFELAEKKDVTTNEAAVSLAMHKVKNGIGKRKNEVFFHHTAE